MKFRTRFNASEFNNVGLVCESPSLTEQQFKDECDINSIIARYKVTGLLGDPMDNREPVYADCSSIPDLLTAQNFIIQANCEFMALPSSIRKRFDNSPVSMLQFLQDPNNREEAIQLGLLSSNSVCDSGSDFGFSSSVSSDLSASDENN